MTPHPPKTTLGDNPCRHPDHEAVQLFPNGHCSCELDKLRAEAERLRSLLKLAVEGLERYGCHPADDSLIRLLAKLKEGCVDARQPPPNSTW